VTGRYLARLEGSGHRVHHLGPDERVTLDGVGRPGAMTGPVAVLAARMLGGTAVEGDNAYLPALGHLVVGHRAGQGIRGRDPVLDEVEELVPVLGPRGCLRGDRAHAGAH